MAVTAPKQSIPTVAEAVRRFVSNTQRDRKNWREHASVLAGPPTGHVVGRQAAGTALARSELGPLRFDRVTAQQFSDWFDARHPEHLSPSTRRRGRSSLRRLLVFAAQEGWADDLLADRLPEAKPSPPRRDWLRPEQLVAIEPLISEKRFEDDQLYMWWLALNAGLRVTELVSLRAEDFNFIDHSVTVIGKGRRRRDVPLPFLFSDLLAGWFAERGFRADDYLFPLRGVRFTNVPHHRASERVVLDRNRHCDPKAFRALCARVHALILSEAKSGRFDAQLVPRRVITPHTLRRTYACNQLIASEVLGAEHGMSLRSLQLALGHASLEVTSLYLADVSNYLGRYRRPIAVASSAWQLTAEPRQAA